MSEFGLEQSATTISTLGNQTKLYGKQQPTDKINEGRRLLSIVLWILSIVCVCLTATNLYLLVWVWTNLAATNSNSIDLLTSANHIKLNARLASKQALKVAQIGPVDESGEILFGSDQAIHLRNKNEESLLSVWPSEQLIETPFGWTFRSPLNGKTVMQCQTVSAGNSTRQQRSRCDLSGAQRLRFAHPKGVDFGGRSIQAGDLRARLLHSPTNRLEMRSSRTLRLESSKGKCQFESMDSIQIGGPKSAVSLSLIKLRRVNQTHALTSGNLSNSHWFYLNLQVILNASAIDLSAVELKTISANSLNSDDRREHIEKGYKLCICLPKASSTTTTTTTSFGPQRRKGFVFALQASESCAEASSSHCF